LDSRNRQGKNKFTVHSSRFRVLREVLREGIRIQLSGIRGKSKKSSKFLVHRSKFKRNRQKAIGRVKAEGEDKRRSKFLVQTNTV